MDISQFSNIFLPHLVALYVDGQLPLHGLVDLDTWKRVFIEKPTGTINQIHWYEISLTCNPLKDHSLLFTFILPEPRQKGQTKFAAIRLMPEAKGEIRATYYTLCKPANILDDWDIFYLPLSISQPKRELKFCRKIEGTDSLRNFVLTVQQTPFFDENYSKTLFEHLKDFILKAGTTQN